MLAKKDNDVSKLEIGFFGAENGGDEAKAAIKVRVVGFAIPRCTGPWAHCCIDAILPGYYR